MKKIQELLRYYNCSHMNEISCAPWEKMYCEKEFPKYWTIVFDILNSLNRDSRIIEIGCGLGNVTAIPCYLGFKHIYAFEKEKELARFAQKRIKELFGLNGVIKNQKFPNGKTYVADVLILVNCVYACTPGDKLLYLKDLKTCYEFASNPFYFILEVIDATYTVEDEEFPFYLRLKLSDIEEIFPGSKISSWKTYEYPENKRSKTLYLIERTKR